MNKNTKKWLLSSLTSSLIVTGVGIHESQAQFENIQENFQTHPRQVLQEILLEIDPSSITEKISFNKNGDEEIPSDWDNGNWFADGFADRR